MITDRIGQHKLLLPINHNYSKSCDMLGLLKIKTQEIPRDFLLAEKKKPLKCACAIAHSVQLLRHDKYCPITLSD